MCAAVGQKDRRGRSTKRRTSREFGPVEWAEREARQFALWGWPPSALRRFCDFEPGDDGHLIQYSVNGAFLDRKRWANPIISGGIINILEEHQLLALQAVVREAHTRGVPVKFLTELRKRAEVCLRRM